MKSKCRLAGGLVLALLALPGASPPPLEAAAAKYPAKPYDRPIITNADGSTGLE